MNGERPYRAGKSNGGYHKSCEQKILACKVSEHLAKLSRAQYNWWWNDNNEGMVMKFTNSHLKLVVSKVQYDWWWNNVEEMVIILKTTI